ncbi:GNAT family N-acetyltransferase [Hymenobacter saemangeumensis]
MPFSIHQLGPADLQYAQELIALFQTAFEEDAAPLPPANYLHTLLARPDFHAFVALNQNQVLGGVTAYELPMFQRPVSEMFLYDIAVAEPQRARGVAAALIEALKALCRQRGIESLFVGTETDNVPALRLYKATGGVADEHIAWFNYSV